MSLTTKKAAEFLSQVKQPTDDVFKTPKNLTEKVNITPSNVSMDCWESSDALSEITTISGGGTKRKRIRKHKKKGGSVKAEQQENISPVIENRAKKNNSNPFKKNAVPAPVNNKHLRYVFLDFLYI